MRHSEIDKRSKRNAPRQCVADTGMHKDAPPLGEDVRLQRIRGGSWEPLTVMLDRYRRTWLHHAHP